jgi:hypothetical protein
MQPPPIAAETDRAQEFSGDSNQDQRNSTSRKSPTARAQRLIEKGYLGRLSQTLLPLQKFCRYSSKAKR